MKTAPLALLLSLGLAVPALAQTAGTTPTGSAAVPNPNPPAATQGAFLAAMPAGATRVSAMRGVRVNGLDIRTLGEVEDVILDREGRAVAVVIQSGGVLGLGSRQVAVPFGELLWNYDATPTDGARSSNTGGQPDGQGGLKTQEAVRTDPGPANPEATGTVGDPARPNEGLRPQNSTAAVTGDGTPRQAVLRMTLEQMKSAPEFEGSR